MKLPLSWLKGWVDPGLAPRELGDRMTLAGFELESIASAAPAFSGVVVAEILSAERHPQADKLQVCRVSVGGSELQIVWSSTSMIRCSSSRSRRTAAMRCPSKASRARSPRSPVLPSAARTASRSLRPSRAPLRALLRRSLRRSRSPPGRPVRGSITVSSSISITPGHRRSGCASVCGVPGSAASARSSTSPTTSSSSLASRCMLTTSTRSRAGRLTCASHAAESPATCSMVVPSNSRPMCSSSPMPQGRSRWPA